MTDHLRAWHWAAAFFALGALLLLVVVATDESTDGAGTATADLGQRGGPQPTVTASFPLEFDPDSAIAPPPSAFARAVEGDSIEVQGEGFLPGEAVDAATCIERDEIPYCQSPTPHQGTADADGAVDFTFTPEPFEGFDGLSDCRDNRCWVDIRGASLTHRDIDLHADLALDP